MSEETEETSLTLMHADTGDELERMLEDERLTDEFLSKLFNPVDEAFVAGRDQDRFAAVLADIQVMGYSRDAGRDFLNEYLSNCDSPGDVDEAA